MKRLPLMLALCLAMAGCATDEQTRAAVTGGAVGAAAGAAMANDADQVLAGALVGGAVGAATAAILADPHGRAYRGDDERHRYRGYWHRYDRRGDDDAGD